MKPLYDFYCGSNTIEEAKKVFGFLFSKHNIKTGAFQKIFEEEIEVKTNSQFAVSFSSGRHALYSLLKAYNIKEGDEVILQAFTCVVVPNAILYSGATPIYIDVNDNYLMDLNSLRAKISNKTKIVIVQHTFGYKADIRAIREVVGKDIIIIEDCAHIFKELEGDAGFISTDHTKVISTSIGGVAYTNKPIVSYNIWLMANRNLSYLRILQIAFTFMIEVIITYPKVYRIGRYLRWLLTKTRVFYFQRDENKKAKPKNYPLRMSNLQSYIGSMQMDKLEENLKHREKSAVFPLLRYSFLQQDKEWIKKIFKKYIIVGEWFNSPVFGCKDLERVKYKKGSCENAEYLSKHIVNFPTHQRMGNLKKIMAEVVMDEIEN